jgi:hypothetical protein
MFWMVLTASVRADPLITSAARRRFDDHRELVATATELKDLAKRQPRSAWAVDRRSNRRRP